MADPIEARPIRTRDKGSEIRWWVVKCDAARCLIRMGSECGSRVTERLRGSVESGTKER